MQFLDLLMLLINSSSSQPEEQPGYCSLGDLSRWHVDSIGLVGIVLVALKSFGIALLMLLAFLVIRKVWNFGRLALVYDAAMALGGTYHTSGPVNRLDEDQGFCSWIRAVFRSRYNNIAERCGEDARHYLSFQRQIIYFLFVATIIALCALIPMNVKGATHGKKAGYFQQTTLENVEDHDVFLWLHSMFAVILSICMICFIRRHSSSIHYGDMEKLAGSIFIHGIPQTADEETIQRYFSEAYPTCHVDSIHLCQDVSKLKKTSKKRRKAGKILAYYTQLRASGQQVNIKPALCSYCCCCALSGCEQVDAVEYYEGMENELQEESKQQLAAARRSHIGMAYVTFSEKSTAKLILRDFNATLCQTKPQTSVTDQLKVSRWSVSAAPYPEDISWSKMSVRGWKWWARFLCINVPLFVFMLFLTTPDEIVSILDEWTITRPIYYLNRTFKYSSNLQLWIFSAVLKEAICFSTKLEAHWFKSAENRAVLYKLFFYLIFMVLIAPSFGLRSLFDFFKWVFAGQNEVHAPDRWKCLFTPHQGAVVIHYVIISAFIANAMDLLRLGKFLKYVVRMATAKCAAFREHIMQTRAEDFPYGEMYAKMLCVITLVMAYSNLSPLVLPFGLLYMIIKHVVDMYNLYYVHLPSKQHGGVHEAAVSLSMTAPMVSLTWLFIFCIHRRGWVFLTVIQGLFLLIAIIACLIKALYGRVRLLCKSSYETEESTSTSSATKGEGDASQQYPVYVPSCIIDMEMEEEQQNTGTITSPVESCNFHRNYP